LDYQFITPAEEHPGSPLLSVANCSLQNDGMLTGVVPRRLNYMTRLQIMDGWMSRQELNEDD